MNKNSINWNQTFNGLPLWLSSTLNFVGWVLKLPNYVWLIPGLSKLKGIRMLVLTALGSIHAILLTVDIDMLSAAVCGISDLFKWNCDAQLIVSWFNKIMMWIIAALAIEDKNNKA